METVEIRVQPTTGGQIWCGVIEEIEVSALPRGISEGRTLISIDKAGCVPCSLVNFSCQDIYINSHLRLAQLETVPVQGTREEVGGETVERVC